MSATPSPQALTTALIDEARRLGFDSAGVAPAVAPPHLNALRQWLADGCHAQMHALADRAAAYAHPRQVLPEARSLLMLATSYRTAEPAAAAAGSGRVSRYAWGRDYHEVIRDHLHALADFHRRLTPGVAVRGVVDTAPLLERDFAQLAGLGWIGKNTTLITPQFGSWVFLAALLTSAELVANTPAVASQCGDCTACLRACPTGALVAPYRLDARRCISYLTVELRGTVPAELQSAIGDRVFGCDACQEACPHNHRANGDATADSSPTAAASPFAPLPGQNPLPLAELFALDDAAFRRRFRGTPLWRAKRGGLLRNAAVVLSNQATPDALTALNAGLHDADPLVRQACAAAIARQPPPCS